MPRLKLLTFDITNTILKVTGSAGQEYATAARMRGIQISGAELDRVYRPTWKKKRRERPLYGHNQGLTTHQWWQDFVKAVFHNAGYHGCDKALEEVCDTLWQRFDEGNNWTVLPHSREVLGSLKSSGLKLGVVSNFDERLEKTLMKQNLRKFFDFTVTSVSVMAEKPSPTIFERALEIAGCEPHQAGHIGDDIDHDYRAARNVGMTPFLIDPERKVLDSTDQTYEDIDRKQVLQDLIELPRLVK